MNETGLSKTDEKTLEEIVARVDVAKGEIVNGAVEIGKALAEALTLVSGKNYEGGFQGWVEDRCGFSRSAAYRYLDVFKAFGKCPKLEHFDDSALYLLAKCGPAATKAKAMATRGQRITHLVAKMLVDAEKPQKPTNGEAKVIDVKSKPAPEREPGDDTEAIKAEAAARRKNGSEKVSSKKRKDAAAALGKVVRFVEEVGYGVAARPHLEFIHKIIKGS